MKRILVLLFVASLLGYSGAYAQEAPSAGTSPAGVTVSGDAIISATDVQLHLNFVWVIVAAALVFFMQAGFALLEIGLTRSKNAVNIIMKNVMDVATGSLIFFAVGFALMFGTPLGGIVGWEGFFLTGLGDDPWTWAFFLFQAVFAATAATIVSGAVAERTKFAGYLIFSIVITGLIYPVFGSWAWGSLFHGDGWLEHLGFIDFAGSTVVHSVGGWAALAGILVVGPRTGKYDKDGNPRKFEGHSLPLVALGVFILWFGWFGFNAGSTTEGSTDIALIAINTLLAGGAGATFAMLVTWIRSKKPDAPMTLNGVLAGLVGITAGCSNLTPVFAVITGAIAGVIVVFSLEWIDRRVDDAVGAVSVHGVCGVWGTLAAGLFNHGDMFNPSIVGVQLLGAATAFVWTFGVSMVVFTALKKTIGLRVNGLLEERGLDIHEHDSRAYPEFQHVEEVVPVAA